MTSSRTRQLLLSNKVRLPYSDAFDRADGDLANGWQYTAGKWTVATNAAKCTPGLGSDLVVNGNMEAGNPPTSWSVLNGSTLTGAADERTGGAGAQSINIARGASAFPGASQNITLTLGAWYQLSLWRKNIDATSMAAGLYGNSYWIQISDATPAAWAQVLATGCCDKAANALQVYLTTGTPGQSGRFDDVVVKQLTLADMFASRNFGAANIDVSVALTITDRNRAGLVLCLDSFTNPLNFLIAAHNRTNVMLTKCINGTYTSLISAAAAYADGRVLRVVKKGNSVSLYYNGVQIGTTQDITGDAYVNNQRHGLFSTSDLSTLDNFQAVAA